MIGTCSKTQLTNPILFWKVVLFGIASERIGTIDDCSFLNCRDLSIMTRSALVVGRDIETGWRQLGNKSETRRRAKWVSRRKKSKKRGFRVFVLATQTVTNVIQIWRKSEIREMRKISFEAQWRNSKRLAARISAMSLFPWYVIDCSTATRQYKWMRTRSYLCSTVAFRASLLEVNYRTTVQDPELMTHCH